MPVVYTSTDLSSGTDVAPATHLADPTDGTTSLARIVSIIDALEGVGVVGGTFMSFPSTNCATATLVTGAESIDDPTDEASAVTATAAIIDALEAAGLVESAE